MMFAFWGYVLTHQRGNRERTHFTVEINAEILAFLIGEPKEEVEQVIIKCCEPDPASRSEAKEGRKLVKLGVFLYEVVNGAYYDKIQRETDKRESDRLRQAKQREKNGLLSEHSSPKEEISTWNNTKTPPKSRFIKPTIDEIKLAAAKIGIAEHEAEKFFAYYESNGWRVGKNPMKSLNGALAGWKLRNEDKQPAKNTAGEPEKDTFWKDKARLELVEKGIHEIEGRASHTAMDMIVEARDVERYSRLKSERKELRTKMNL